MVLLRLLECCGCGCKDIHLKKLVFNYPIDKAYFINKTEWKEKYKYDVIIGDGETVMERVFK